MCRHVRTQVGFMLVDELARQLGTQLDKLQHNAAVGRGRFCGKRVLLAKPMTFMNNSGESVGKMARYFKARDPASWCDRLPISIDYVRQSLLNSGDDAPKRGSSRSPQPLICSIGLTVLHNCTCSQAIIQPEANRAQMPRTVSFSTCVLSASILTAGV